MNILTDKRWFFAGVLFFGLLAMTARNAIDPDLWWHLRTGQLIVETGKVPHTDPFSFTKGGSPWVSHEWLSEIVFYQIWKHGGPTALIIFSAVITTAGFLLLYWRCPGKAHWAAAATVIGAWACAPCWGVRPQMFTFTLASLLLWLLARSEERPWFLLWIPPLFLLWLNLHAGFALGPALMFLYATGLILEAAVGKTTWHEARPPAFRVFGITLICLALIPINPSGLSLYRYPFDTLRSPGMRSSIVEWFSPDFHQWLYAPFLAVLLLLLLALSTSHRQLKWRVLLPLVFASYAALDAVRHIPIFVLLAIPVIAQSIADTTAFAPLATTRARRSTYWPRFAGIALTLLAIFAVLRWTTLARSQQAREADRFPQKAVAFLETNLEPERAFVFYDWGGYTIWKLYPRYRVFVDGRADLYGDKLLVECIQTVVHLRRGWRGVLDSWNVQTVLIPPNSALAQALLIDPQWAMQYRDTRAVVFIRRPVMAEKGETSSAVALKGH